MKIQSLTIDNFRCFKNFRIDFNLSEDQGGTTVVVAKNGEGKTAILDAINVAWGTFIGAMPDTTGGKFFPTDSHKELGNNGAVKVGLPELTAIFEDDFFTESSLLRTANVTRRLTDSKKPTTTVKDAKPLVALAKELRKRQADDVVWPVLAYYGDSRLWSSTTTMQKHFIESFTKGREYGYVESTNSKTGYGEFSKWFTTLTFVRRSEELNRANGSPVFDPDVLERYVNLDRIVRDAIALALEPSGWDGIDSDGLNEIVAYSKAKNARIPVSSMSAGIKIVIGVVADLAYRCCKLNPHLRENTLKETTGIVLIDEVELHLHPAWQQRIVPSLQRIFPKLQFILTTHSPQVVSSVSRECVRVLADGDVVPFEIMTEGARAEQILNDVFGVDSRADVEVARKLKEYQTLVQIGRWDSPEALQLHEYLRQKLCTDPELARLAVEVSLKEYERELRDEKN